MVEPSFLFVIDTRFGLEIPFDALRAQRDGHWRCLIVTSGEGEEVSDLSHYRQFDERFSTASPATLLAEVEAQAAIFVIVIDADLHLHPELVGSIRRELEALPDMAVAVAPYRQPDRRLISPKRSWDRDLAEVVDTFGPLKIVRFELFLERLRHVDLKPEDWPLRLTLEVSRRVERRQVRALVSEPLAECRRHFDRGVPAAERPVGRTDWPRVAIIVPTRDQLHYLRRCIETLATTDYPHLEIVVIDNGSVEAETLAYLDELRARPEVTVLRDDAPFNFSALNNRAARKTSAEVLVFLNNDTEIVEPGWLKRLIEQALREDVGPVGALLLYPDRRIQHAGVLVGADGGVAGHLGLRCQEDWIDRGPGRFVQEVSAVTAACLAIRRCVFHEIGGFDEALAVSYNDVDLCLRAWAHGYRVLWDPLCRLIHHESVSRQADARLADRDRALAEHRLMTDRWRFLAGSDLHYSANHGSALPGFVEPA